MLTEGPCLAHYAKDKDNIVTTDASITGLGISLWQKQDDGNTKPIAYVSRPAPGRDFTCCGGIPQFTRGKGHGRATQH